MVCISSKCFKTGKSFKEIVDFFEKRGFNQIKYDFNLPDYFNNKNFAFFEIDDDGLCLEVIEYSDTDRIQDFKKEFNIPDVMFIILVKENLDNFIFYKIDIGTETILKLDKRRDSIETIFLKKLNRIEYNKKETLDELFDRSEFIKEFYQIFVNSQNYLITNLKSQFTDENECRLFVTQLMNRLMFLWFLQKKNLLDTDENYLLSKYKAIIKENKNYSQDFLKILFFNGLNLQINDRTTDINDLIGKIPFLNGGLFRKTDLEFKNENIKIPNRLFFRDIMYENINVEKEIPLLTLLDSKEWTVDERSGEIDKLSPEILGYIFEKTISKQKKGTVYTPEEITMYIAKNTIERFLLDKINKQFSIELSDLDKFFERYLKSDDTGDDIREITIIEIDREIFNYLFKILKSLTVLDPAVGSGHFLIDALKFIEKYYFNLKELSLIDWTNYKIREYIITNNLFGIDLEVGAIEITKLRLFLALAELFKNINDVKPLPNIEFNYRVGNSIIGFAINSEITSKFFVSLDTIDTLNKSKVFLNNKYPELAKELDTLLSQTDINPFDMFRFRNNLITVYKSEHDTSVQLDIRNLIYEITAPFYKELNDRFYAEIMNVFRTHKDLKKNRLTEKEKKAKLFDLKPFHWIIDFSEIIGQGGFDIIIENPPYISNKRLTPLEKAIFQKRFKTPKGLMNTFVIFIERSIKLCHQSSRISYIIHKNIIRSNNYVLIRKFLLEKTIIEEIIDIGAGAFQFVTAETVIILITVNTPPKDHKISIKTNFYNQKYFTPKDVLIKHISQNTYLEQDNYNFNLELKYEELEIINYIKEVKDCELIKYFEAKTCIATGDDEKFLTDHKVNSLYKKTLRGKNIRRFYIDFDSLYVQYNPEALHRARDETIFQKPEKLIMQTISSNLTVAYDNENYYPLSTCIAIIPKDNVDNEISIKYLLLLLNSRLMNFYYDFIFNLGAHLTTEISVNNINQLPIKLLSEYEILISLSDFMLQMNKNETLREKNENLILYLDDLINFLIYEIIFFDKFQIDGLTTDLSNKISQEISKIKRDSIEEIRECINNIKNNDEIAIIIQAIKQHPWIKIIDDYFRK